MLAGTHRTLRRDMGHAVRLIDSTQIDLGLRMRQWVGLHRGKPTAKLHLVYDPRAGQPVFHDITSAAVADIVAARELLPIEPKATYVFDPARDAAILSDHTGRLPGRMAASRRNPFDAVVREIKVRLPNGPVLRLVTNDLDSPAREIANLYRERWQIELFFKWIKQNLRIARFIGRSENAVRIQLATALIAYLLVRLAQARHAIELPATTVLTVIRAHLFRRESLVHLVNPPPRTPPTPDRQMTLFLYRTGTA